MSAHTSIEDSQGDIVTRRRTRILEIARGAGRVEVDDLATRLDVTPQTIRKDLNVLAEQALPLGR